MIRRRGMFGEGAWWFVLGLGCWGMAIAHADPGQKTWKAEWVTGEGERATRESVWIQGVKYRKQAKGGSIEFSDGQRTYRIDSNDPAVWVTSERAGYLAWAPMRETTDGKITVGGNESVDGRMCVVRATTRPGRQGTTSMTEWVWEAEGLVLRRRTEIMKDRWILYELQHLEEVTDPAPDLFRVPAGTRVKPQHRGEFGVPAQNVGQSVKEFTLPQLGSPALVTLSAFKGKVVLLNFFASWCAPCHMEMPDVIRAYQQYHPKGVEFLSINGGEKHGQREALAQKFADYHKMKWPVLIDDEGYRNCYPYGLPTTVIVDANGKITACVEGMVKFNWLRQQLDAALLVKPTP